MLPWQVTNAMPFETESCDIGSAFTQTLSFVLKKKIREEKTYRN